MSFARKVKNEIASNELNSIAEVESQLYGMMLFGSKLKNNRYIISSENGVVIKRFSSLLKYMFPKVSFKYIISKKNLHTVIIQDSQTILSLNDIKNASHFLSGAFLVCGSITNPTVDYHLEFNVCSEDLSEKLIEIFSSFKKFNFNPKNIKRRNHYSVYLKENEKIADFLALMGANVSAMEFMQIKMIKEVRNNINRTTNFETANLSKTTSSSSEHIQAIKKIIEHNKLSSLPQHLQETALIRLNNPYMSLKELSALYKKPLSKSGINHRLKKLIEISKNL